MENKKYILTDETIEFRGRTLHRIKAIKDFGDIHKGDLGGWIEAEKNLSQDGECWVHDEAKVYDNANVFGNADVFGNAEVYMFARIYEHAEICSNAEIFGFAEVYNDVEVFGNVEICGNAKVKSNDDYAVFKNTWSSGRYFTWTRSNKRWKVGCFYGTGKQLIRKAYKDSEISGKCYETIVNAQETIVKVQRLKK